jgi:hypothetical protein
MQGGYVNQVVVGVPQTQFEVVVPQGVSPGMMIFVTSPISGRQLQVTVPQGMFPGYTFIVQEPQGQVAYQQQTIQQQPQQKDDGDCAAFAAGMCFCCTLCCLAGNP